VVSDGTFPVTGALAITTQEETGPDAATVSGSASLSLGPGRLLAIPALSGSVTAAGAFDSAFALVGLFPLGGAGSGTGFFPGTGAFQGQVTGESLALTMTGALDAPTSCQLDATLTVSLAPAP